MPTCNGVQRVHISEFSAVDTTVVEMSSVIKEREGGVKPAVE